MTERNINKNFQGYVSDFLHWGKIIMPIKEQYCTVFYFWTEKNKGIHPSGATGFGVKTLVQWIKNK